jgi:hypothetical protein
MVAAVEELCMLTDLMEQADLVAEELEVHQMELVVSQETPILVVVEAEEMVLSQTQLQVVELVELEELQ